MYELKYWVKITEIIKRKCAHKTNFFSCLYLKLLTKLSNIERKVKFCGNNFFFKKTRVSRTKRYD